MKVFLEFLRSEIRMVLRPAGLIAMVLLAVVSLVLVKMGIDHYRGILDEKELFQSYERSKVASLPDYMEYGKEGHQVFFLPSPTVVFFVDSLVPKTYISRVDMGEEIKLGQSFRGKKIFTGESLGGAGFSGIIFLYGGLLAIYYGFTAFRHGGYLRMLTSMGGWKRVYRGIFLARVLVILIYLVVMMVLSLLLMLLNGVLMKSGMVVLVGGYFSTLFLAMVFLFSLGVLIGFIKSLSVGYVVMFGTWFMMTALVPQVFYMYFSKEARGIRSEYLVDMEGLKIAQRFEKRLADIGHGGGGGESGGDFFSRMVDGYKSVAFRRIMGLDRRLMEECRYMVDWMGDVAVYNPITFYLDVRDKVSGIGSQGKLGYWEFVRGFKVRFMQYILTGGGGGRRGVVEDFVKGTENIFVGGVSMSGKYGKGVIISLVYIIVFGFLGYIGFRRQQVNIGGVEERGFRQEEVMVMPREGVSVWVSKSPSFGVLLYSLFMGRIRSRRWEGLRGKFELGGIDILLKPYPGRFIYVCSPGQMPGEMKVRELVELFHCLMGMDRLAAEVFLQVNRWSEMSRVRIGRLDMGKRIELLLGLLSVQRYDVMVIEKMGGGWEQGRVVGLLGELKGFAARGSSVIYVSDQVMFNEVEVGKSVSLVQEDKSWRFYLDYIEAKREVDESEGSLRRRVPVFNSPLLNNGEGEVNGEDRKNRVSNVRGFRGKKQRGRKVKKGKKHPVVG